MLVCHASYPILWSDTLACFMSFFYRKWIRGSSVICKCSGSCNLDFRTARRPSPATQPSLGPPIDPRAPIDRGLDFTTPAWNAQSSRVGSFHHPKTNIPCEAPVDGTSQYDVRGYQRDGPVGRFDRFRMRPKALERAPLEFQVKASHEHGPETCALVVGDRFRATPCLGGDPDRPVRSGTKEERQREYVSWRRKPFSGAPSTILGIGDEAEGKKGVPASRKDRMARAGPNQAGRKVQADQENSA
mmetsp:Transcript_2124/g.13847  ORF Transcript_2124/g.13847 Transcript_2124/m.13847 type:complete len:244 (+) Transcript_2124:2794-3525(+)